MTARNGLCVILVVRQISEEVMDFLQGVLGARPQIIYQTSTGVDFAVTTRHRKWIASHKAKQSDSVTRMAVIHWQPTLFDRTSRIGAGPGIAVMSKWFAGRLSPNQNDAACRVA